MNFEDLEQVRSEVTTATMQLLLDMVKDTTAPNKERLQAAKQIDMMSDSIIKAYLMSEVTHTHGDVEKDRTRAMRDSLKNIGDK